MDIPNPPRERHTDMQGSRPLDITAFRRKIRCGHGLPYGNLPASIALGKTFIINLALPGSGVEMLTPRIEVYDKLSAIDRLLMTA